MSGREQLVDLGQLRDPGLGQAEALLALQVGGAGQPLVQTVQLAADDAPDLVLVLGVGGGRRGSAGLPRQGERGQRVAPGAVLRVDRTGVVVAEVDGDATVVAAGHGRVELCFFEHSAASGLSGRFLPSDLGVAYHPGSAHRWGLTWMGSLQIQRRGKGVREVMLRAF